MKNLTYRAITCKHCKHSCDHVVYSDSKECLCIHPKHPKLQQIADSNVFEHVYGLVVPLDFSCKYFEHIDTQL